MSHTQHADELRRQAEEQLAARESRIETLERADLVSLAHELAVHQTELEIQNEELRRAQLEAQEARDRYLDLYDFAPVGYFTLDEHSRIVEANLTGCRLLSAERHDLLKTRFAKFLREEDADKFYFHRKAVLEGGVRRTCELKMVKADGAAFDARLESIRSDVGRLRVAVTDVTERSRAEEELRRQRGLLETVLNTVPAGVLLADAEGSFTYASPHVSRIFGQPISGDASGPAPGTYKVLKPDHTPFPGAELPLVRAVHEGRSVTGVEMLIRHADGTEVAVLADCAPVRDSQGRITGAVASVIDITDRKRAEEALEESEEKYRGIVETAAEGIVMVDADARTVFANDRWSEIYGYSLEEARHITLFDLIFPEDRAQMAERWESRKRGVKETYEFRFRRKDGRAVWTLVGVTPRFDPAGRFLGTLVMVTDVTQRKRADEQLRELTRTLESKVAERTVELEHRARQLQKLTLEVSQAEDRERKRMAEILHDDLQQIIAGAKFHLSLLRNRVKDDASLQAIASQIDGMLKDAIEKSRGLSHELSPAILYQGDFTETLGWLAHQMQAKHGLVVHVHAHGPAHVSSDGIKTFLYKTAQELLFNVVKHARVNEARIRFRRCGPFVCLSVSDRGRGFDPQGLRETAGFGLLSIRERIELLGGRTKIKSAKGKGSTFFIVVPDGEQVVVPPLSGVAAARAGPSGSQTRTSAFGVPAGPQAQNRLRVLLADDHRIVREGLRSLLGEEYDIEIVGEAAHGREAVDLALRLEPDVVIMDVSMPLIDGDEATRQIKEHRPKTRVVALSTYNEPETIQKMYRAGVESYVLKTASSEELLAAIRGKEPDS